MQSEDKRPPESKSGPLLRVYFDFDGTLTRSDGQAAFNNPIFNLLKSQNFNPDLIQKIFDTLKILGSDTADAVQKQQANKIADEFVDQLAELDYIVNKQALLDAPKRLEMTPEAIQFISEMAKKNVEIVIISRNYKDYLEGMLKYHGIKAGVEVHHRQELDSLHNSNKGEAISKIEASKSPAAHIYICDDNSDDLMSMKNALIKLLKLPAGEVEAKMTVSLPAPPLFNSTGVVGRNNENFLKVDLNKLQTIASPKATVAIATKTSVTTRSSPYSRDITKDIQERLKQVRPKKPAPMDWKVAEENIHETLSHYMPKDKADNLHFFRQAYGANEQKQVLNQLNVILQNALHNDTSLTFERIKLETIFDFLGVEYINSNLISILESARQDEFLKQTGKESKVRSIVLPDRPEREITVDPVAKEMEQLRSKFNEARDARHRGAGDAGAGEEDLTSKEKKRLR